MRILGPRMLRRQRNWRSKGVG